MLEPGTIVALCVSVISQTVKFIDNCHALHTKLNSARRYLSNLINLVSTVRSAVREVHQWAQGDLSWLESDTINGLKAALRTCSDELHVLEGVISKIKPAAAVQTLGFKGKISMIWNEDVVNTSQNTLSVQMQALSFLLQIIRIRRHPPRIEIGESSQPMIANPTNIRLFQQWSERRREAETARRLERRATEAGQRVQQRESQYGVGGVRLGEDQLAWAAANERRSWETMFGVEGGEERPSSSASTLYEAPQSSATQTKWEEMFK
ncbi:hypothetical protein LTR86_006426 [Recurvomyces mirabilis]|nr:hypothetical protein LTR86_006426 [Recurvomyces mirabilis]